MARKVLIVDDSELSRTVLRRAIEASSELEVVGEARTGEEAVQLARTLQPDLVTMDLVMPGMGGLEAMARILQVRPVPVVVISEKATPGASDLNRDALAKGAWELVPKAEVFGGDPANLRRFVTRLEALTQGTEPNAPSALPSAAARAQPAAIGIGVSTGGPRALAKLLRTMPEGFAVPLVVVQHLAADFFDSFVRFLGDATDLEVRPAVHGEVLRAGHCTLAPPGLELTVDAQLRVSLLKPRREVLHCPSVDALFTSMAVNLGPKAAALLMTGMGADGALGLRHVKQAGGFTAVQDPASCAVGGMPQAAIDLGVVDEVAPLEALPGLLGRLAKGEVSPGVSSATPKRRILVCDDSHLALEATRLALEEAGYQVKTLDNPLMVPMVVRREQVDALVLDVDMPTVKGPQVVDVLRSNGLENTPVVLFSALADHELASRAKACGAKAWVRKSADPKPLLEALRSAMERR